MKTKGRIESEQEQEAKDWDTKQCKLLNLLINNNDLAERFFSVDNGTAEIFDHPHSVIVDSLLERMRGKDADCSLTRRAVLDHAAAAGTRKKDIAAVEVCFNRTNYLSASKDDYPSYRDDVLAAVAGGELAAAMKGLKAAAAAGTVDKDTVRTLREDIRRARNEAGFIDAEQLKQLAERIRRAAETVGNDGPRRSNIDGKTYPPNDIGNADLFADYFGDDVRYVHEWKQWIVWDGKRWTLDNRGGVKTLAMKLARNVMADVAKTIGSDDERQRYLKHVAASQQRNKVEAMIALAQSLMTITANDLDTDVWLLNVENGTIDLRTGEIREHRRDDLLTKMSPVNHAAEADCPRWREHIDIVTDEDAGLADYLQRAVGYSMTGSIGEQCFFLLYGQGNNGKTVFVEVIKKVLGYYGMSAPDTLLMDSRQRGVNRADEAELRGVRFASLSEPNEGERINEKKVKQLTNKTVNAMQKFGDPESFDGTHKIWLDTNHKPKTNATDLGFWRRVKMIPFLVNIPSGKRIKDYEDVLASEEGSGILRWMLDGLAAWQERGLTDEPRAMVEAVNDYRNESDILGQFLADETQDNDAGSVEKAKLYDCYKRWCSSNGMESKYTLTMLTLTKRLKERGCAEKRTATVRGWSGLKLIDIIDHDEEYDAAALRFD